MKLITKFTLITLLLCAFVCGLSATSYATVPHIINYQGKLTDSTGKPVTDGTYNVTFKLYDNSAGSNPLWSETQTVTIQKGIFNVPIGGATSGGINLAFDKQYYLGIQVGSDTEMRPLQQVASSAYAFRSENADNATKVNNIEASTTPQANKLLPLDTNAKIPFSTLGLKVYDSGWFSVNFSTTKTYIKTHNLGTTKILPLVYFSTDSNGANAVLTSIFEVVATARGICVKLIDANNIKITLGSSGGDFLIFDDNGVSSDCSYCNCCSYSPSPRH